MVGVAPRGGCVAAGEHAAAGADLERTAQAQGLNMERFRAALDNRTHEAGIREDMSALDASGAEAGTPASFINGRFVSGAQPFAEFQRVIDSVINAPAAR